MSHDRGRKGFYGRDRDGRDHDREWDRPGSDYRNRGSGSGRGMPMRKRSRSLTRGDLMKRRSRSPRKNDKDMIDDNILSEISKLPEPSELWDNNNQFQEGGYVTAPPPPSFTREPSNQSYGSNNYPAPYSGMYDDFPPLASAPQHPSDMASWNQMALPPPPAPYHNPEDQLKKEAAIESEMRHQKAALSKQREDYIKKSAILKKELDTLKDQRNELRGDAKRSPSPDTKRFLKENTKLQLEIQNKLKTINNVVDMLNGIIGEEAQEIHESDESPERKRKSRSPTNKKFNYVYYDPEMHWCRVCNEFPPTAKDYLNHLHSVAHHKMAAQHMEAPWHTVSGVNEGFPSVPSAPTKRTPIRGLQFFVPSSAWYCKLCDQFIGDLHCASAHLKSIVHSKNYTNFVEQNPHWETDWMSDRQKAFEKARAGNKLKAIEEKPSQQYTAHTITFSKDGFHTKRPKKSPTPQPDEKKKKKDKKKKNKRKRDSSSSSSSQSESSDSEAAKKKKVKTKKVKSVDVNDDKALQQWMSNINSDRLSESDRKLLDSLKNRIKKERDDKQRSDTRDIERVKEMQRKIRESERHESRSREQREERRESRDRRGESRDRRDESRDKRSDSRDRRGDSRDRRDDSRARDRWERRDKREETQDKKPEIRKMPFIGKMPVYKHLGKTKAEEQKKEEQKKKEDTDNLEKKRQELDAEIQRKVAEFKQKIARAQLERQQQQVELPPPALALPAALGSAVPPPVVLPPAPQPPPPAAAPAPAPAPSQPALPKDFQEALDIIFPTDAKSCNDKLQHDLFSAMQQPGILGVPPGIGMSSFPPMGLMQHPAPGMFGFDMNAAAGLFPQPQLYDSHVPLMPPNQQKRPNKNNRNNKKNNLKPEHVAFKPEPAIPAKKNFAAAKNNMTAKNIAEAAKKKEEMDDLAMLGIDASDVGAGI